MANPNDPTLFDDQKAHAPKHEGSDVDIRAIVKYVLILFAVIGAAQLLLWGIFALLENRSERADAKLDISPLADTAWNFQGPQLQPSPADSLRTMNMREDSVLTTYGWIDKGTGKARIPIDRAIEIVAEQGLPARK